MIEYRIGDVLASDMDVVMHGCNCKLTMGAGIARQIKEQFPNAYDADIKTESGDRSKLGHYIIATQNGKTIINGYTQFNPGKDVDYQAIRSVMKLIKSKLGISVTIGMPRIGCGIAGGDWNIVEKILDEVFDDRTVYVYDFGTPDWAYEEEKWVKV